MLRKLTLRKIWNLIRRNISIGVTQRSKKLKIKGMPWSYSIEPTDVCNLRCKECVSGLGIIRRRRGNITLEDFRLAADSIAPYAVNCFLYFQGEPFINPQFAQMVEYASKKKIFVATSTNGHFVTSDNAEAIVRAGLDKIIVSLDGACQQTYEAYRAGGNFQKAVDSIRLLADAKKKLRRNNPVIEVQTIVNKVNENELESVRKIAIEAGANKFALKTMQIERAEDFDVFKTTLDKYSRYDSHNQLKHKVKFCRRILNSAVITIDLDVLPCCYDKDAEIKLGNLRTSSLEEVLSDTRTMEAYSKIEFSEQSRPPMCENCGG